MSYAKRNDNMGWRSVSNPSECAASETYVDELPPIGSLKTQPEDLRTLKCLEIDAARLAANSGTFKYLGKDIAVDALSRSDIDGVNGWVSLTGTLPANWFGGWKAVDNTVIPITSVDGWKALYGALVAAGQANFLKSQQLKAHVSQLSTPFEMDLIRW